MHEDTFPNHTTVYSPGVDRDPSTVGEKLRSTEAHCEHRGHELPQEDPTNMEADLTKIANLYNEGVRMPALTEPVVPIPTSIKDDVTVT